jgi:hypothetical protein
MPAVPDSGQPGVSCSRAFTPHHSTCATSVLCGGARQAGALICFLPACERGRHGDDVPHHLREQDDSLHPLKPNVLERAHCWEASLASSIRARWFCVSLTVATRSVGAATSALSGQSLAEPKTRVRRLAFPLAVPTRPGNRNSLRITASWAPRHSECPEHIRALTEEVWRA